MNNRIANHQEVETHFNCSHAPVGLLLQEKKGFVEKAYLLQRLCSKEKGTADQAKWWFLCALAVLTFSSYSTIWDSQGIAGFPPTRFCLYHHSK